MRILIAGGGIAGLTLATLLGRQGHHVIVAEKRTDVDAPGYGLALWPHGTRVLHSVGVYTDVVQHSMEMRRYTARDGRGRLLSTSTMPREVSDYGHLGLLARGELVGLLRTAASGADIRYGTTVVSVEQDAATAVVRLSDGDVERVDVLVGADGIGSGVRDVVFGDAHGFDSGWACLVWWADSALADAGEIVERWGSGSFLGTYPCPGRLCVIAGAPIERIRAWGRADAAAGLLHEYGLTDARWTNRFTDGLTLWPMADVRASRWTAGRVALVGDAAAAFLPTAGIGASMALESAAALADELSRADAFSAPHALALYELRRRRRTERAQTLSRRLARLTFVRSRPFSKARNLLLAHSSVETLVSPLLRDLRRPI